ncbi:uncharacterized protein VTP21DRAFT_11141 [Calcarisporiella thermophila]|uniref:uncharacterized protein n=1 Tax=Calcarisporiella thermophila TaxID=911321 RepID=UPI0037444B34
MSTKNPNSDDEHNENHEQKNQDYTSFTNTIRKRMRDLMNPSQDEERWDEYCLQWCKQQSGSRRLGEDPECRMICFQRQREEDKWWRGYRVIALKGTKTCNSHIENMSQSMVDNQDVKDSRIDKNEEAVVYEIDIGEKVEQAGAETTKVIKRTFTPVFTLLTRYTNSFTDGTQSAFFERFAETVKRMDAVHLVHNGAGKLWGVWSGRREGEDENKETKKRSTATTEKNLKENEDKGDPKST